VRPARPDEDTAAGLGAAPVRPAPALGPGAAFGERYTIVEEVGAGGMGRVYKAIDRLSNSSVALKVMSGPAAHPEARQRFQRELALGRAITHLNVCRVHDLGEVERTPYISMEFVEGQTLDDLIRSVGVLSTKQTLAVARQICSALSAIHEGGVVHRDLKPSNIMLDRVGRAIVMDFGMAYQRGDDHLTDAGAVVGTLAYLSPEQSRGEEATFRSDIYALGLILYEMLSGRRPPGDGAPLPLALRDRSDPCPPPSRFAPDVPPRLDDLVMLCLQRDPRLRPESARLVDTALAAVQDGQSVTGIFSARSGFWRAQRTRLLVAGAVLAAAVLAWWLWPPPPPRAPLSLALLPLVYTGPEDQKYLRNVVPLLISDRLRNSRTVPVVPYTTVRTFDGSEPVDDVAAALGVNVVVQGTLNVRRDGAFDLTLTAQRSRQKEPEWSRQRQAASGSVLDHVDQLQRELAAGLRVAALPATAPRRRDALEHYLKGRTLFDGWDVASNARQAEEEFRAAAQADPGFPEAHAMLAQAEATLYTRDHQDGHLQTAEEAARRALALNSSSPEAHLALGVVQLARGKTAEAKETFEEGLDAAPADDALLRNVARAYAALARPESAEGMFKRARDLRPSFWSNHNELGAFYVRKGRLPEAAECFLQVISLHPTSDTGYSNLAAVYILQGRHDLARPLLETALKINPTPEAHNNLGLVHYATGHFADAAREWQAAIDGGVHDPITFSNLGDADRQLGLRKEADQAYLKAVAGLREQIGKGEADSEPRATLAMTLAGLRRCAESAAEARQADERRRNPTGSYYLAIAYAVCGNDEEATRQAVRAVEGNVISDVRTNPDLHRLLTQPALARALAVK